MILVIDNYDSFVYNLARYIGMAGAKTRVVRNDALTLEDIEAMNPEAIVISPGPCTPQEAGICIDAVKKFGPYIPILGVCLGHQAIGEAYGGRTARAKKPVHGKATAIRHNGTGLFENLPSPLEGGRYHSLTTKLPEHSPLKVTAISPSREIMAMQHEHHPVYGVQFHPESVLTRRGMDIVRNFTALAAAWHGQQRKAA